MAILLFLRDRVHQFVKNVYVRSAGKIEAFAVFIVETVYRLLPQNF